MTVEDSKIIDKIGITEDDKILLIIFDHLEWGEFTSNHILLLQEKINDYIAFIESNEIYDAYPNAKGKIFVFRICFKYTLDSGYAMEFISAVKNILNSINIELEVVFAD